MALLRPIQQLSKALIAVARAGRSMPFPRRYQMLAPAVYNAFDLPVVLRLSVGPSWRTLPQDQQYRLQQAFRSSTIAAFVSNFDSYDGQQVRVLPVPRQVGTSEVVVGTDIALCRVSRDGSITSCGRFHRVGRPWTCWRMARSAASRSSAPTSARWSRQGMLSVCSPACNARSRTSLAASLHATGNPDHCWPWFGRLGTERKT
jgi:hypothetical protein